MWLQVFDTMNWETKSFLIVILIFNLFFHIRFTHENAQKAPAFLTTLGILGTFIGIALGLWHFDANNVQKSVPSLIEGIKTAVWVSAFGILCALTIKLRDIIVHRRPSGTKPNTTAADIADILLSIDESLAGEGADSLINQIKQSRREQVEQLSGVKQSIDNFYGTMAEANSKALVAALNDVIRDFNTKLNEQFGDNFKRLNEASEKMLLWQQEHKAHITDITANMKEASSHYSELVGQAGHFSTHAAKMGELLSALELERNQIQASLTSLGSLIESATKGLPQIETQILEITRQLGSGVKATNDTVNANVQHLIEKTKEQVLVLDAALSEELTKSLESFGKQMASLSQKFADDYGPITERLHAILKIGK